jgi:hypothetical protein
VSSLPVKPEFRPTLPELVSPRLLAAVAAVLAVIGAIVVFTGAADSGETQVIVREPVAFNLRYGEALERVDPRPGELVRFEGRDQSFAVRRLSLPPYRGEAAGTLPVIAEDVIADLRSRHPEFDLADEGRVRVNEVPGYSVGFRARRSNGERVWGRTVLLVPDEPGARQGVTMELLAGRGAGVSNAAEMGAVGQIKLPYRSFRFGTDPP